MSRVEVEGIFEEVDAQLEAENVARFWQENQPWIITGMIALFLGLFAYVGWGEYQKKRDLEVSERYLNAVDALGSSDDATGRQELIAVSTTYAGHGYALLARLTEARALAGEGKKEAALPLLEEVVAKADPPLRDLALLQTGYLLADEPGRSRPFLDKISRESSYKPVALELAGVLIAAQGDAAAALALYKDALSLKPDSGLRKRLERRIQRMGG
ncbi:MAG: tetratricopeptide repeat protein [Magnetococcales bacterium]|nr:tetratricopeptide repeat protein [Magnetococcales bacterium]